MQEEIRKKIVVWFIIIIMVSSVLGFVLSFNLDNQSDLPKRYNGFKLNQLADQTWTLNYNEAKINFFLHPKQLESTSLEKELFASIESANEIVLLFDANDTSEYLQAVDTMRFLITQRAQYFDKSVSAGVINQSDKYNLPIYSCSDKIEKTKAVLKLESNSTGQISKNGSCIIIPGSSFEMVSKLDYISYLLLGVIKIE